MGQFNRLTKACVVFLLWRAAAVALPAQTAPATSTAPVFTSLHSFENTDGANPYAGLVQGADGNFYGTTSEGGDLDCAVYFGCGTIFKITPSGKLTTLYSVCSQSGCPDGTDPRAGLAQDVDGNFYGTADEGGDDNCIPGFGACGTVFKITLTGTLTTLHSFEGTDGAIPGAGLVQGPDGNFHGTADEGGANTNKECARSLLKKPLLASFREKRGIDCSQKANKYDVFSERHYPIGRPEGLNQQAPSGCGTVFRMTPGGTVMTLYSFCSHSNCTDDAIPSGGLVLAADGNFYGTTSEGGQYIPKYCPWESDYTCGTVFKITPTGTLTTLYMFCSEDGCSDGINPAAGFVQGADGNFYGTTSEGGANTCPYPGCGTVFKITPTGTLTTLHTFCSQGDCLDGYQPDAALIQGTDGNLYRTTAGAGAGGYGTIFGITPVGNLKTLHRFDITDDQDPHAALVQGTDGTFYGTTVVGGADDCPYGTNCGTVFSLSVSLGPFVNTNPAAGKVGATVGILGTDLTGATGVKFNGTETAFRVVSSSFIEAKVPSGATTGKVQVKLPSGTLSSNVPFYVLQ